MVSWYSSSFDVYTVSRLIESESDYADFCGYKFRKNRNVLEPWSIGASSKENFNKLESWSNTSKDIIAKAPTKVQNQDDIHELATWL